MRSKVRKGSSRRTKTAKGVYNLMATTRDGRDIQPWSEAEDEDKETAYDLADALILIVDGLFPLIPQEER